MKKNIYLFLVISFFSGLGLSDTYNFYFPSPKKGKKASPHKTQPSQLTQPEEGEVSGSETPVPTASQPNSSASPPIIINNNIDTSAKDTTPVPPAPAPLADEDIPVSPAPQTVGRVDDDEPSTRSKSVYSAPVFSSGYRLGLGAVVFGQSKSSADFSSAAGAMASFGADVNSLFGANFYLGLVETSTFSHHTWFLTGGELELHPFRSSTTGYHPFDLAGLGGIFLASGSVSNSTYSGYDYGNTTSKTLLLPYFGARAELNFNQSFGLHGTVRTDTNYLGIEVGIGVRL